MPRKQQDNHYTPIRKASKTLTIPNAWMDDVEQQQLSLLVGIQNSTATLENSLVVPQKVKDRVIISGSSTLRYIPKRNENTFT